MNAMRQYSRRVSLRLSFVDVLARKALKPKRVKRLKGLYLFRAISRLVLEYYDWLVDKPEVEEVPEDVSPTAPPEEKKKVEKKKLTLQDRAFLMISPEYRTSTDKAYVYKLLKRFNIFKKYPENLKESVAGVCRYQYLRPGRVIIRQNRRAENLYFLVNGEISLSKLVTDDWTGETKEVDMGVLTGGDIFGQIALLHKIPRSATAVTKTRVDLILIPRNDFDAILREYLTKEWDVLQDALVHFNYFKSWTPDVIRECCILSRLKDFDADEVLLGDGKGMVNYVHFILEGECRLIEHMLVREKYSVHGVEYELYIHDKYAKKERKRSSRKSDIVDLEQKLGQMQYDETALTKQDSFAQFSEYLTVKTGKKSDDAERTSIITTTLLDVLNEWHKITDVAEMLMREPSTISQQSYPSRVRTIFMQICTFNRGACFGLGEDMVNRRIVSTSRVRCFLVPRYWLNEHNRANIWERVKLFINSKLPTKEQLFKEFVRNRKWMKYKKNLVEDIGKQGRFIFSNVTVHDVPYAIRIINDVDSDI